MLKTKLCGFTNTKSLICAIENRVDFIGFVFYPPSPRNISPKKAQEICQESQLATLKKISKVAVIVEPDNNQISEIIQHLQPDFLQIHSDNKFRILEIKSLFQLPIIKAFSINGVIDLNNIKEYEEIADLFLFDTKTSQIGGSGKNFDWHILQNLTTTKQWFLSGGLNIDNIQEAIKISKTKMIDLSSGIEEFKGEKSSVLIEAFMNKIKSL